MGNSGQARCPARQTRTGREQPRRRPFEGGSQACSRAARYHRQDLRQYHQPSPRPFPRTNLPLSREHVWKVLRGNREQEQSKQQPPHHKATILPRIEHGGRQSIGLSIPRLDLDLPTRVQFALQRRLVRRAIPQPNQVQLLKIHQPREAHKRTLQILRAPRPMLTLRRNSPSP